MAVLDEMKNLENQKKEFMAQLGEVYYKNCKADGADVPAQGMLRALVHVSSMPGVKPQNVKCALHFGVSHRDSRTSGS